MARPAPNGSYSGAYVSEQDSVKSEPEAKISPAKLAELSGLPRGDISAFLASEARHAPAPEVEEQAKSEEFRASLDESYDRAKARKKAARSGRKAALAESVKGALPNKELAKALDTIGAPDFPRAALDATGPEVSSGRGKVAFQSFPKPGKKK